MLSHDNSSLGVVAKDQKLMPEILALHAKALFDCASMVGEEALANVGL
jgi:hypothetical protein